MIAAIIGSPQVVGLLRIAQRLIKIDDSIEVARSANPLVNRQPIGFACRTRMIVAI